MNNAISATRTMPQMTTERRAEIRATLTGLADVQRAIKGHQEAKQTLTNRLLLMRRDKLIDGLEKEFAEKSAAFATEHGCHAFEYRLPEESECESESDDESSEEESDDEDEDEGEDEGGVSGIATPPRSPERSVSPELSFQEWTTRKEKREAEEAEAALEAELIRALDNAENDDEMTDIFGDGESTDLFDESVDNAEGESSDEDEEPQTPPKPVEKQPAVARSEPSTPLNRPISRKSQQPARSGGIVLPPMRTPPHPSPVSSVSRPSSASSVRSITMPRGLVLPTGLPTPPSSTPPTRPISRVQSGSTTPEQTIEQQHGQATGAAVKKPAPKTNGDKKRKRSTTDASRTPAPAPKKARPSRAKPTVSGPAKILRPQDRPRQPDEDKKVHTIRCGGLTMDEVANRVLREAGAFRNAFKLGDLRIGAHYSLGFQDADGTITMPDGICPYQFAAFLKFADHAAYDLSDLVSEEQLVAPNTFERMNAHAALMKLAVDLDYPKYKGAIFCEAQADRLRYLDYEDGLVVDVDEGMSAQRTEKAEVLRLYEEIRSATPANQRMYNWLRDSNAATSFDQNLRNYRYRSSN